MPSKKSKPRSKIVKKTEHTINKTIPFSPSSPKIVKIIFDSMDKTELLSDGHHTFGELYEHRFKLFMALCKMITRNPSLKKTLPVWKSKMHSDGSFFKGWFIMGIGKEKGKQITYHLPLAKWRKVPFAETLKKGPEFDNHTPNEVLKRLGNL